MAKEKFVIDSRLAVKAVDDISKALKDVGKEAGLTDEQLEKMTKSVQEAQQKLEGGFKKPKKDLLEFKSISEQVGKAFVAAFAVGKVIEYTKALINLEKQYTGLAGAIAKFSKENGKTLVNQVAQVKALSKNYKQETDQIIIATNNLAKSQNITFQKSLDLVTKGLKQNADALSAGKFLDQLTEYPDQLKRFGLSAEQTIAAITVNIEEGFFTDKFVDSLKEAGLALTEFTKTQYDAIKPLGEAFAVTLKKDIDEGSISAVEAIQRIQEQAEKSGLSVNETATIVADVLKGAGEDAGGFARVMDGLNKTLQYNLDELDSYEQAQSDLLDSSIDLQKEIATLAATFSGTGTTLETWGNYIGSFIVGEVNSLIESILYLTSVATSSFSFISDFFSEDKSLGDLGSEFVKRIEDAERERARAGFEARKAAEEEETKQLEELNKKKAERAGSAYRKALEKELAQAYEASAELQQEIEADFVERQFELYEELAEDFNTLFQDNTNKYEEELRKMAEADDEYLSEKDELFVQDQERRLDEIEQFKQANVDGIGVISDIFRGLGLVMDGESARFLQLAQVATDSIGKIIAAKNAEKAASQASTAAHASESVAKAGSVPFPGNLIAIAATVAALVSALASVKNIFGFNKGVDYVPGPDTTGDSVFSLLTPGERVTTKQNNKKGARFFNLLDTSQISYERLGDLADAYVHGKVSLDQDGLNEALARQPKHVQVYDKNGWNSYLIDRFNKTQIMNKKLR